VRPLSQPCASSSLTPAVPTLSSPLPRPPSSTTFSHNLASLSLHLSDLLHDLLAVDTLFPPTAPPNRRLCALPTSLVLLDLLDLLYLLYLFYLRSSSRLFNPSFAMTHANVWNSQCALFSFKNGRGGGRTR